MNPPPKTVNPQQASFYIKGFDGLRALSILLVMLTHIGVYDNWKSSGISFAFSSTLSGHTGVTVFFTISGFLITLLLLNEKSPTGSVNYKNFIIRRFLRLLPALILFYLILTVLIITGALDIKWSALMLSVFYLYNFVPNRLYFSEIGHTWSLAVEEQFYFCWPWVIYFFQKKGLLWFAAVLSILALLAVYYIPDISIHYKNKLYYLGKSFHTDRFFLPAIAPIMIGSACGALNFFHRDQVKQAVSKLLGILLFLIFILSAFIIPLKAYGYLFIFHAIGFAGLLSYIYNNQAILLTDFLEWKPLAFIGKISYGIYVWQGLFLRTGPDGELWIQKAPQNIVLTLLVAVASYYLIEKRVMKLKHLFKS